MKLLSEPEVYEPQEDSFLMEKLVSKLAFGSVLEIGVGSGILSIAAALSENVSSVLACDMNEKALLLAKKNAKLNNAKIKLVYSDLFSKIKEEKFDFIIFNPPYLPKDRRCPDDLLEKALSGGKKGHETIERFIIPLSSHLNPCGKALIAFSSLTGKEKIDSIISGCLFEKEEVSKENVGFEELYTYLISRSALLEAIEEEGISSVSMLAKGHRGLVYSGCIGKKKVAIKAKNPMSGAVMRIENEVAFLTKLNKEGIGPKLILSKKDFFAEELIDGKRVIDYLKECSKKDALSALKEMFLQARKLDLMGIEKEEMHHPIKHFIFKGKKAFLIDFERCHYTEKPSNVTQLCQFFSSKRCGLVLSEKGPAYKKQDIISAARKYRQEFSDSSMNGILSAFSFSGKKP